MRFILSALVAFTVVLPTAMAAEQEYRGINISPIQSLYSQQLSNPENESIATQIADKRRLIREILEKNITKKLEVPNEEDAPVPREESLTSSIEKQTAVLSTLAGFSKEAKVDNDLLKKEEKEIYLKPKEEVSEAFRLTESHAELLAKVAVVEEEIGVVGSLTDFHTSRLQRLQFSQRLEQYGLLITLGKYFAIIMVILFVEKIIRKKFISKITKTEYRYAATKLFTTTVYTFTLIWIAGVTFSKNPSLLASVAIIGAGLAIALQDVVKDLVGGFVIFQHQLFTRGNRISFGNITGEVIDSGLLRTTILEIGTRTDSDAQERTGKTLSIPNALFLTQPVTNHNASSDFVRSEMQITITFESDAEKAKQILQRVIDIETEDYIKRDDMQVRRRMQLYYFRHATRGNQVYMNIAADGVEFTMRFTTPIGERRPVVSKISSAVLAQFALEKDIDLAYTTQRILAEVKQ
ncbi:mechanosensitive ion channel [Candidatus Peregrinibacteria bacterium]|jgi:small-conductance mechanosensitive channel|nr:mechanosensitive ion channel [Candidatus Peregrinibacteria bacterium]MBT5468955.1 mechanosensitive ion channel [Candidatus Peregrinibacteria bacterium]MBT7337643.1 mechanosensitive ion channel [Candidatus Peregrinibacteria bacterium]